MIISYQDVLRKYENLIMEDSKYYNKLQPSYAKLIEWESCDFTERWSLVKED